MENKNGDGKGNKYLEGGGEEERRRKGRKIFGEGKYLVSGGEEKQNRKKEENNWSAEKEGDEREVICHKFEASCKLCT